MSVVFRLSIVGAIGASGIALWRGYVAAIDLTDNVATATRSYECAARVNDARLIEAQNAFGNINIGKAPFWCSSRDFYVSMPELQSVREGTFRYRSDPINYVDWVSALESAVTAFLMMNLVGLSAVALAKVVRWVLKPLLSG